MSIQLIIGPMFSGKTTELFRRVDRYEIAEKRVIFLGAKKDTRSGSNEIRSHGGLTREGVKVTMETLNQIDFEDYDVISIDEGQFFDSSLVDFCVNHSREGKTIIISGLSATSEMTPFDTISKLIAVADQITHVTAVCGMCGNQDAPHSSIRKGIKKEGEVQIGGKETYIATCRVCYYSN